MAGREPKYPAQITQDEHENDTAPFTKRVLLYGWDPVGLQKVRLKVDSDGVLDTGGTGGSGTEYVEGATDSTITGTAIMWEDTSDTLRAVSAAKPLPVNIISGAGSGGTASADDADFTAGTTNGTPAMGVYESTPTSVTDGDLGIVGITAGRRMKTSATIDAALPAGTNNIGDVDIISSALPTGASTSANQTTIIGHLDGVEGLLGTIDADTGNISTKIDTLSGAVSGSEMQVDIVTIPTITVNSHAVTNAGTFAVQVDGSALTALQLIDDTVATLGTTTYTETTTKGNVIGAVRRDADTTLVDTTNEIGPLQMDANGRLKVEAFSGETLPVSLTSTTVTGTVAVTQSGTWSVRPDSYATDDTAMPATPLVVPVAGEYRNAATTYTDGDATVLQSDVNGYLKVNVAAGGTSGTQYTEGDTDASITGTAMLAEAAGDTLKPLEVDASGNLKVTLEDANISIAVEGFETEANPVATSAIRVAGWNGTNAYTLKTDTNGELQVDVLTLPTITVNAHAVTNAGTFAVQATVAAGATNIAKAEDVASADADVGVPAMAVRKATPTNTSGTDGDYEMLQMSAGRLWTSATIDTALPAGTNAIGKLAANSGVDIGDIDVTSVIAGTGATNLGKAEDAAHTTGDTGVMALGVRRDTPTVSSGTTGDYEPISMDANGATWVSLATKLDSTNDAVQALGNVAHDAADSGNPVKIGFKAKSTLSGVTLVAADDRTDGFADLDGAQVVRPNSAIGDYVNGNANNTDGASTQVLAAGAAGIKHYITDVTLTNTSSSNIYVELKDGTTVKWTFPLPANGGVTHRFGTPIGGTAATAWNFDPSAATTTVYCSVAGFKSKI